MGSGPAENDDDNRRQHVPDGIAADHLTSGLLGRYRGLLPLAVLGVMVLVALTGALGGAPNPTVRAEGMAGTIEIKAPQILRNGTFFEMDIAVVAQRPIAEPVIAISRSYLKDMTVNTHLPEPADMGFEGDAFTMTYPAMDAGDRLLVKLDGQINPPLIGRSVGTITLRDDKAAIAEIPVALRVLP